jgi:tyrosinase
LTEIINEHYSNLPHFISLSKRRAETAGASLLPQAALLKKLDETQVTANVTEMRRIDAELPEPQVLLQQSLEPGKPFLRDLAPNNKYLEWLVDIKAEKHALDGGVQVHVFLGPVQEDDVCCVEASLIDCYLRNSGLYVHESCCLGNERHPLTYVGCRRF